MTSSPQNLLPDDVREALDQGNKIEAIKRLRESTRIGLKEAKDLVENHGRGAVQGIPEILPDAASVADALQKGNKIEAIKRLRQQTGLGLKDAKDAIDALQKDGNSKNEDMFQGKTGNVTASFRWLIALAIAGLAVFYFLRNPG